MIGKPGTSGPLAPYEVQPRPHDVMHLKCMVIRLIKEQMARLGGGPQSSGAANVSARSMALRTQSGGSGGKWNPIHLLGLVFLLLTLFLYGALIGANVCQSRKYGGCGYSYARDSGDIGIF